MKTSFLFLALVLAVSALFGCTEQSDNVFQGYVEGEYVHIAPSIGGTLTVLSVSRGDQVRKDDSLFELDHVYETGAVNEARHGLQRAQDNLANLEKGLRPSEIASIQAQLKKARAAASLAKVEYERRKKLVAEATISQEEMDRAQSDYQQKLQYVRQINADLTTARLGARSDEIRAAAAAVLQAEAQLSQVQWALDQKMRVAPTHGLIFDTLYRQGEWVAAGSPVVSLLPPENIEVRCFVPQALISKLRPGQTAMVSYDGMSEPVATHIYYISTEAEYTPPVIYSSQSRAKLVFMVKARPAVDDAVNLHPGQPVDVSIPGLLP